MFGWGEINWLKGTFVSFDIDQNRMRRWSLTKRRCAFVAREHIRISVKVVQQILVGHIDVDDTIKENQNDNSRIARAPLRTSRDMAQKYRAVGKSDLRLMQP